MPLVSRISAGEGLAEMILELDVVTERQGWRPAWAGEQTLGAMRAQISLEASHAPFSSVAKRLTSDS